MCPALPHPLFWVLLLLVSGCGWSVVDQEKLYEGIERCLLNFYGISVYDLDNELVRRNYNKPLGELNLSESTALAASIDNLFDEEDLNMLNRLHTCVAALEKERYIRRTFYGPNGEDVDGNIVLYLTGILSELAPALMERVISSCAIASERMGWNHLPTPLGWTNHSTHNLGIRCIEIISYNGEENSGLAGHMDTGSVYTLIALMVEPMAFEGGRLMVGKSGDFFEPPLGGAVLFQSEALHALTRVSNGHRRVFSVEFWDRPTAKFGEFRPSPT